MAISKNDDRKVSRQSAKQMYVNRKFDKQFHSFQAFLSFYSFGKSLIHYITLHKLRILLHVFYDFALFFYMGLSDCNL